MAKKQAPNTPLKDSPFDKTQTKVKPYPVSGIKLGNVQESFNPAFYQTLYANPISLLASSKNGLSARVALDFLYLSGFSPQEFQHTFKTTVKTIQNYAVQDLTLDASLSEKLLKSFALFEKGISLFGAAQAFHNWLMVPAYGLGNQIPFDLMDTITGINFIEEELIRLEYGDLA